jgi:O-antigen/teichoic acid export membrane protein
MRWFFRRVAAVAASMLACFVIALSLDLPGVPLWAAADIWPLGLAALAWMTSTELDNAVASALKAQGRFDVAARSEVAARIAQLALIAAWVGAGSSALVPIFLSLFVTVAKFFVRLAALRRQWPSRSTNAAAGAGSSVVRELAITGLWVWIGALGSLVFNAFDRWFVGAWFGASTLAAYAICTQLAQLPHAVVAAAGQVLVPWAARNVFQGPRTSSDGAGMKLLVWATALAALPSLLLLPLLEPALGLWISKDFAHEHLSLARGLTVAFLLLCLNVPGYFLLLGMGQARLTTIVISLCGLLFVLGALSLPRDLSTFVILKGVFAALALALPIGCALRMKAKNPAAR